MRVLSLPESSKKIIEHYSNLNIAGQKVRCPYFMNLKRSKDLRALVGKGTPEEIEMEVPIWAKLRGFEIKNKSADEIRQFMQVQDIGIDCSGFVIHVLNTWYKDKKNKNIWKDLKIYNKGFLHKIAYFLKPVEKLGAEIITSELNADKVELKDVKPGDLIRSKWKRPNSHHILLVSKVTYGDKKIPSEIEYVNSTEQYGDENGVRTAKIIIKDINKPLQEQDWRDADANGVNHTLEGFMYHIEDNGLRRLKCMKEL